MRDEALGFHLTGKDFNCICGRTCHEVGHHQGFGGKTREAGFARFGSRRGNANPTRGIGVFIEDARTARAVLHVFALTDGLHLACGQGHTADGATIFRNGRDDKIVTANQEVVACTHGFRKFGDHRVDVFG